MDEIVLDDRCICGGRWTQNVVPKPITQYSWEIQDSRLSTVWKSKENVEAIRESFYMDVSVQHAGCVSGRCSCKRKGKATSA